MYKLIAIDIDGTLMNSYGEVSDKNISTIKKAIEKGTEVVLTSGRITSSIQTIANEIGANNFLIAGNGALIYDMQKEEIIYNQYIDKSKILEIIRICEENSIYYNIYTTETVLASSLNYNVLFYNNENRKYSPEKRTNINITENIYQYVEQYEKKDFLKVTICDNDKIIFSSIMNKLKKIKNIAILEVANMSSKVIKSGTKQTVIDYFYTEITNKNVNKWTAIEYLMSKLNIKKEEVMAIGDNVNDKEMIENAGLGIAMGNSCIQIRNVASEIVSDNNSDGVAEAIKRHILQ